MDCGGGSESAVAGEGSRNQAELVGKSVEEGEEARRL